MGNSIYKITINKVKQIRKIEIGEFYKVLIDEKGKIGVVFHEFILRKKFNCFSIKIKHIITI